MKHMFLISSSALLKVLLWHRDDANEASVPCSLRNNQFHIFGRSLDVENWPLRANHDADFLMRPQTVQALRRLLERTPDQPITIQIGDSHFVIRELML